MANKEYDVEIGGITHTLLLSDEDAKARGLKPRAAAPKADTAVNKARSAANKSA